jgi:hypothetical protein
MPDSLNTLLELNGYSFRLEKGYWVKFEAYLVNSTEQIPHGISYCITFHDRYNKRIIGFDNSHGYSSRSRRKKFGCRRVTWDHVHNCETVVHYDFESATQLIEDFWEEVSKIV